ncbi:hypothetical protein [Chryseobacterium sp. 6424]|uniref:hypothetical protein n=1 Tax=Chryseobacterium sp. 6424 TaxID=2039166 RepID=UPI0013CE564B|nr:hypothetical protein [Chryseobacterium sp. 6424]
MTYCVQEVSVHSPSPLIIHHSPFTIHHSPFTIHHSPLLKHSNGHAESVSPVAEGKKYRFFQNDLLCAKGKRFLYHSPLPIYPFTIPLKHSNCHAESVSPVADGNNGV